MYIKVCGCVCVCVCVWCLGVCVVSGSVCMCVGVWSEDAECCWCENARCLVVCLSGVGCGSCTISGCWESAKLMLAWSFDGWFFPVPAGWRARNDCSVGDHSNATRTHKTNTTASSFAFTVLLTQEAWEMWSFNASPNFPGHQLFF